MHKGFSQFSHQLGLIGGPVAFQSDYGEDKNFDNIKGNLGFSIGVIHYMNLALNADCDCFNRYTYFNDHFMIRNEFIYMQSKLDHFGQWVSPEYTSLTADQLRAMHGEMKTLSVGSQLEYYPVPLREFLSGNYVFVPYASLGFQANYYFPRNYSDLGNIETQPEETLPVKYQNGQLNNGSGIVMSAIGNVGIKVKITRDSDLMVDLRYQYYFSDWVDGMRPDPDVYTENQNNDTSVSLSLGYIFYL
ncbi:glutamate dehydrogenase [Neptunitalea sp. Y10]|uniref:Glutamate dehydrogenase n=1 Tax=Neptunitalea lumnitzerae TaxID=2965509 RepID=A0ABQ5MG52_9FLAO|nr:glutamate dehydrogenase [Neptunitalea sp. Y10]